MASSDKKLAESSIESPTRSSQMAGTSFCRSCGLKVFRQLYVVGTVSVIIMGIVSTSYLECPLQAVVTDEAFDPVPVESLSKYRSIFDHHTAGSDQSSKMLEEDSGVKGRLGSRESAEEAVLMIPLLEENVIDDGKHVNDGVRGPSLEQNEIDEKEGVSSSDTDAEDAKETSSRPGEAVEMEQQGEEINLDKQSNCTTDSAKVDVSPRDEEKRIDVLREEREPQDEAMSTSGEETGIKNLSRAEQNPSAVETSSQSVNLSATKFTANSSTGGCDLAVGKWVRDPAGPLYRSDQCSILSQDQNCRENGRPDDGYEFYKWRPDHCSLPRFDAHAFLEMMRDKTLAFVGDSLARNQMESLMCILLQASDARSKGGKGIHKWHFSSHNFTVVRKWSSWLVRIGDDFPPSVAPKGAVKLNLTELDSYAEHLPTFDVTVLSSGHWWLRKTAYFMNGEMLGGMGFRWLPTYGKMKVNHSRAYDIAWNSTLQKVGSYPGYKGLTILRTYTPDHYRGGSWRTGGSCTGETEPYQEAPRNLFSEMMRDKQVEAFEFHTKNPRSGNTMPNGSRLRLLDVYTILNYRGDGHPGPYRNTDPLKQTARDSKGHPPPQDCLHWCMPGPVDTMNELLFHLLKEEM